MESILEFNCDGWRGQKSTRAIFLVKNPRSTAINPVGEPNGKANVSYVLPYNRGAGPMTINPLLLQPLVALVAGILILVFRQVLHIIVGLYLILVGILGLWPHFIMQ